MLTVSTCESDLDIHCDKYEPTEDQRLEVDLAAENLVKNNYVENVDFVLGSIQSLRKV